MKIPSTWFVIIEWYRIPQPENWREPTGYRQDTELKAIWATTVSNYSISGHSKRFGERSLSSGERASIRRIAIRPHCTCCGKGLRCTVCVVVLDTSSAAAT